MSVAIAQEHVYYRQRDRTGDPSRSKRTKERGSMHVERRTGSRTNRRVFVGGIAHETNTFSRIPTDYEQFRQRVLIGGHELISGFSGTRTVLGGFLDGLTALRVTPIPLVYASATPGGIVTRAAYGELRRTLLDGIRSAGDADAVLLALHGAMVTDDVQDAEADLLQAVRALVGPRVPVIATLDSHANLSNAMVESADALIAYTTYPHVDTYERGYEATQVLQRLWANPAPATAVRVAPPVLASLPPQCTSTDTPMSAILTEANRHRTRPGVLNISVTGGFPYSDVADAGIRVLVTTQGNRGLAEEIAHLLARQIWTKRAAFSPPLVPVRDAIERVRATAAFPIVLSDSGDNPGAGAPCDGTILLHAIRSAEMRDVIFGVICDPVTVAQARTTGTGATMLVQLGGKTDDRHGTPVEAVARVVRITDGVFTNTGPMGTGGRTRMGMTAVLDLDGIHVIVTEQRVQALDLSLFRSVGIEPTTARALVLKSSVHFRAAFAPIAAEIIEVDTPGISSPHLEQFTFRHIPRPVWPLDRDVTFQIGE